MSGDHAMLPNGTPPEHTDGHEPRHGRQRSRIFGRRKPTRLEQVLDDHDAAEAALAVDDDALSAYCLKLFRLDRDVAVVVLADLEVALLVSGQTCRVNPTLLAATLFQAETFRDRQLGAVVASAINGR